MKATPRPSVGMEAVQRHLDTEVVHQPPKEHRCTFLGAQVGAAWWLQRWPELRRYPNGTVRACPECGATWVAGSVTGFVPSLWRRERRLERWLRTRKETPRGTRRPVA